MTAKNLEEWEGTSITAVALGVTAKYLLSQRLKIFEAGVHYNLKNPHAYRPTYTWHVEKCRSLLAQLTKEAAAIEKSQQLAAIGRGDQR